MTHDIFGSDQALAASPTPAAHSTLDCAKFIEKIRPNRLIAQPVYQQLANNIIQIIESGELGEGFSLPSERTLAEQLQLSRTTIRHCYNELRTYKHIDTQGRAGVVINSIPRLNPQLGKLKGFTQEMLEQGMTPSTRLIERKIVNDRVMSTLFNRPSSAQFLKLVRIRSGNDVPLSYEVAWYDLTAAPSIADWDVAGSAYEYLKVHCGIAFAEGEQTIEAVLSSPIEEAALGIDKQSPCLLMKRKLPSVSGQLIEYVEGVFRGDTYTYRIKLAP